MRPLKFYNLSAKFCRTLRTSAIRIQGTVYGKLGAQIILRGLLQAQLLGIRLWSHADIPVCSVPLPLLPEVSHRVSAGKALRNYELHGAFISKCIVKYVDLLPQVDFIVLYIFPCCIRQHFSEDLLSDEPVLFHFRRAQASVNIVHTGSSELPLLIVIESGDVPSRED